MFKYYYNMAIVKSEMCPGIVEMSVRSAVPHVAFGVQSQTCEVSVRRLTTETVSRATIAVM
jgi:hypothetical protein